MAIKSVAGGQTLPVTSLKDKKLAQEKMFGYDIFYNLEKTDKQLSSLEEKNRKRNFFF